MDIKIYSTPTCPYCKMAKSYFSSKGIPYTDYDVSSNQPALDEMVKLSGQMGVPVIIIDGQIIVGFDQGRIDSILGHESGNTQPE
ncbi:MAG: Uxx-star family glutaredoxin-like (seleno)protein [Candidatus Omnitrophica bacterium]|nr:Uxx-star family glutaredoxin-like (seleno)protein [Candidatus Omnitrophota bacterium]